jgi:hypothetical protein
VVCDNSIFKELFKAEDLQVINPSTTLNLSNRILRTPKKIYFIVSAACMLFEKSNNSTIAKSLNVTMNINLNVWVD